MNDLKVFENSEFGSMRTMEVDGEVWFVGKDVAEALGYKDTSDSIRRHVDDEDKLMRRFTVSGQNRDMTIINESGLYSLVLSSKLPSAKQFKRWVTKEVIPSIRKTGSYAANQQEQAEENRRQMLFAIAQQVYDVALRDKLLLRLFEEVSGQKLPQAVPRISPNNLYTTAEVAKILGCTPQRVGSLTSARFLRTKEYMCNAWSEEGRKLGLKQDYYRASIIPVLRDIIQKKG